MYHFAHRMYHFDTLYHFDTHRLLSKKPIKIKVLRNFRKNFNFRFFGTISATISLQKDITSCTLQE